MPSLKYLDEQDADENDEEDDDSDGEQNGALSDEEEDDGNHYYLMYHKLKFILYKLKIHTFDIHINNFFSRRRWGR